MTMKQSSPQSPTGSVSSSSTSPISLHTNWSQSTTTNRLVPAWTPNNNSSSTNDAEQVDDDLFGSAAWRKKRGAKRGAKPAEDNGEDQQTKSGNDKRWAVVRLIEERAQQLRNRIGVVRVWVEDVARQVTSPSSSASPVEVPTSDPPLKTLPVPGSYELTCEVLVQQARLLCGSYIYHRLCSKGLMNRRVHVAPYHTLLSDELCSAGQEMERLYPRVYSDVSRRISVTMSSAQLVRRLLTSVLEGTFKSGVTWAKVVSMVTIAGAFAEECVLQGHPNFVEDVVMCVGHFVTLHLTGWLAKQGGWAAFPTSQPPMLVKSSQRSPVSVYAALLLFGTAIFVLGLFTFFLGTT